MVVPSQDSWRCCPSTPTIGTVHQTEKLLPNIIGRIRVLQAPTKDFLWNTRRFGRPLMKAAASCRNVWYFKENLWLVISARETWVMQPSQTSFFNKITGRSHLSEQADSLPFPPGMKDLEYRTLQLELGNPIETQSISPLHSSSSLKVINLVKMKTQRMSNSKRRDYRKSAGPKDSRDGTQRRASWELKKSHGHQLWERCVLLAHHLTTQRIGFQPDKRSISRDHTV